jgi:integrase
VIRRAALLGTLPKITETLWHIGLFRDQWIALLGFSAAAWKCRARDQWIGWNSRHQYHRHKEAGIEGFLFHDMRHTAINNWRLQGHDYFLIMAASSHKTMNVFKEYRVIRIMRTQHP